MKPIGHRNLIDRLMTIAVRTLVKDFLGADGLWLSYLFFVIRLRHAFKMAVIALFPDRHFETIVLLCNVPRGNVRAHSVVMEQADALLDRLLECRRLADGFPGRPIRFPDIPNGELLMEPHLIDPLTFGVSV